MTDLRSKCSRTALAGPRITSASSAVVLALICSCSRTQTTDPGTAFSSIRAASQRGDFSLARTEAERYYAAWQSRPAEKWHWKFKLLKSEMLLLNGETRQAESLLRSAPPRQYSDLQPRYEMLQGYVAFREGKDANARTLLAHASHAAEAGSDFESAADAELLLAAYPTSEDTGQTEQIVEEIVKLAKTHHLLYQESAALLNLGLLRIHQSRFASAIPYLEQAGETATQVNALLLYSMSIGNLSTCYYNLGDFDRALELRKQAIAIQQHAGLATPLRDSYLELGSTQLLLGETQSAIENMRRALALANEQDTPEVYCLIASQLASALEANGNLDEADRLTSRAITLAKVDDPESHLALVLNQAAIKQDRGSHDSALKLYLDATSASGKYPWVAWSAEAAAAEIYAARADPASTQEARSHFESALRTIEASRAEQLESKYEVTFLSRLIRFYQEYVAFLMRHGDMDKALLVADSSRASVLTNDIVGANPRANSNLVTRTKAAASRSHAAFLFYFLAPVHSYLWIITDQGLNGITLPDQQEINGLVRSYQRMLEIDKVDPLHPPAALPTRLFRMLIGPALPFIGQRDAIVLIPDGALHRLNFETLVVDEPPLHYWLDDVTLAIAPSLSILASKQSANALKLTSLLLIGDPEPASAEYPPLPNANIEMEQVRQHFSSATTNTLSGAAAVPSAYELAKPERFTMMHIAAHAEANERSPLDSAIILSPEHDGYRLYARQIMNTHLNADLVTLSACRSAGARTFSGEGPVGFVWAFFQAGAKNVVASLWDVNDRSTAALMNSFYTALESGDSYAEALRRAKREAVRENSKPYYWAPFQLYIRRFPAQKPLR